MQDSLTFVACINHKDFALIPRSCSLFDLQPEARPRVEAGIAAEGSNLCGMAACISWTETDVTASR